MNRRYADHPVDPGVTPEDAEAPPARSEPPNRPSFPLRLARVIFRPRSIKAKLSRILVASLLLVTLAMGAMVAGQLSGYREAVATTKAVGLSLTLQDIVHQLQRERGLTNGVLNGGGYRDALNAQRPRTDAALSGLNATLSDPDNPPGQVTEVRAALAKLNPLAAVRTEVDADRAQANPTFGFYSEAIGELNYLYLGIDQSSDPGLRQGLQALYSLADGKEAAAAERGLLLGVFIGQDFPYSQYTSFAQLRARKDQALELFQHQAGPEESRALEAVLQSPSAGEATGMEAVAAAATNGRLSRDVNAQAWWEQMSSVVDGLRTVQQQTGADVTTLAERLRDGALRQLVALLFVALVGIGVVMALVIGAARSIIGPLGVLATDADDVAARRLPEAVERLENTTDESVTLPPPTPVVVPAHAGAEIKRVARALLRMESTALSLATEQAMVRRKTTVALANLGRRNQNLVRRQLSLISEFEREELNPGTLANMFELDHLATRMRRNAESLLVLVGEAGPKPWSSPQPIVDVIRAALSEVEDYRRVTLKRIDEVHIAGAAVTDVAHMLAELVENGLSFSPPDVDVEIFGRKIGNQYTIAVVDHGAGMRPDALATANSRLHDEENYLSAPTKFLGHYVVGRLARRLGAEVSLAPGAITGVTARLVLPAELVVEPTVRPGDEPPSPGAERGPVATFTEPEMFGAEPIEDPVGQPIADDPFGLTGARVPQGARFPRRPPPPPARVGGGVPMARSAPELAERPAAASTENGRHAEPDRDEPAQPEFAGADRITDSNADSTLPGTAEPPGDEAREADPMHADPAGAQAPDQSRHSSEPVGSIEETQVFPAFGAPPTDGEPSRPDDEPALGAHASNESPPVEETPSSGGRHEGTPSTGEPDGTSTGAEPAAAGLAPVPTVPAPTGPPPGAQTLGPVHGPSVPPRERVDVRAERARTRNGLVKRQPRTARPLPRVVTRPAEEMPTRERSPSEIGSMLSSYRSGHQRGAHAAPPRDLRNERESQLSPHNSGQGGSSDR
ncbi:nitrate- and nitrite sensing domain-containing protein [Pseudonocardia eucalypti]|uniref:histidine kinase n=1 Tax=Pseudonocardia eucalypti TaxID=648755 RepID=A0ABP9RC67_9PSEU|nr:hypothetical protein [Pseudonocardia eucalypti]